MVLYKLTNTFECRESWDLRRQWVSRMCQDELSPAPFDQRDGGVLNREEVFPRKPWQRWTTFGVAFALALTGMTSVLSLFLSLSLSLLLRISRPSLLYYWIRTFVFVCACLLGYYKYYPLWKENAEGIF